MDMKQRHPLRRIVCLAVAASLTGAAGSALAAGEGQAAIGAAGAALHGNAGAGLTVEQRLGEELRVVVMDLIQNGAFGSTSPQEIALNIESPPQKVSNLGLLVDSSAGTRDGLHVLAVTPGGSAERMGLRAGDVLVALNGSSLAASDAATTLKRTVDATPDGGRLEFRVNRDGTTQTVSGASSRVYLPAMQLRIGDGAALASNAGSGAAAAQGGSSYAGRESGCGRISDFDVAPRGQQLHAAKIISIDGVTPGPHGSKSYRVSAGPHTIKVSEHIESRYFSFNDRQRNSALQGGYKTIDVDVAPDTTYLVAARLNEDQRDNPKDGAYWDPVVWKETPETCR